MTYQAVFASNGAASCRDALEGSGTLNLAGADPVAGILQRPRRTVPILHPHTHATDSLARRRLCAPPEHLKYLNGISGRKPRGCPTSLRIDEIRDV
jgi:hypothetical protein